MVADLCDATLSQNLGISVDLVAVTNASSTGKSIEKSRIAGRSCFAEFVTLIHIRYDCKRPKDRLSLGET
jgi:hypothetical protein